MKNIIKLQFLPLFISFVMLQCACTSNKEKEVLVQAHQGGVSLYPDNTVLAMMNAVKLGVNTLEFDLQITNDSQVIVSNNIRVAETKSQQLKLTDLIDCVETYTYSRDLIPVNYNIEIKSPVDSSAACMLDYKAACDHCMRVLLTKNLKKRLCIQSFDPLLLNYIHRKYPYINLSYLVKDRICSVSDWLKRLDFVPQIISPNYDIVDEEFVSDAHDYQMQVVPWVVDRKEEVLRLKNLDVDEIITNKPDSVQLWLAMESQKTRYIQAVTFFEKIMGY